MEFVDKITNLIQKRPYLLLPIYFIITLIIYRNTKDAGMVFDFTTWVNLYQTKPTNDVWNSFGYPGLHQLEQLFLFSFYKLFGFNSMLWYVAFSFFHAVAAFVAYFCIYIMASTFELNKSTLIAFFSSFLFLISGYSAEVVVCKVMIHYILSSIFTSLIVITYFKYLTNGNSLFLFLGLVLFFVSMFALEIMYMIPFLIGSILIFTFLISKKFCVSLKTQFVSVGLFIFVFVVFLFLHKFVVGRFIGHYGESHLAVSVPQLIRDWYTYHASFIFQFDLWNYKFRNFFYETIGNYYYVFLVLIAIVAVIVLIVFKSLKLEWKLSLLFFLLFSVSLLPVINLYIPILNPIENDRYSYVASVFVYAALITFMFGLPKNLRIGLLGVYLVFGVFLLRQNVRSFAISGQFTEALLNDFRWTSNDYLYILTQPENCNGSRIFSTVTDTSEFIESLYLRGMENMRTKSELIYELNVNSVNDSVIVTQVDNCRFNVRIGQWGTWFWKYHNGALPYETDKYFTQINEDYSFDIIFKEPLKTSDKLIYFSGLSWKEVAN